ncbi:phage-related protein [Rhodococcus sp. 27YEA15]|uniref:hypothetical protein n=1 Tax=Rhodococcus sp. 27YEA15 TaxID=3156259 RepID=UPI003C7E6C37
MTTESLIDDVAVAAGVPREDAWRPIEQINCIGRAHTPNINRIAALGLPIWQWIAKRHDMSYDELRAAARAGEVSDKMVFAAIEANIGGLAVSGAKS